MSVLLQFSSGYLLHRGQGDSVKAKEAKGRLDSRFGRDCSCQMTLYHKMAFMSTIANALTQCSSLH